MRATGVNFRSGPNRPQVGNTSVARDAFDEVDAYFALKGIKRRAAIEKDGNKPRKPVSLPKLKFMEGKDPDPEEWVNLP